MPVYLAGQPWGQVELRFEPLRAPGWRGHLQDPSLKLSAFLMAACSLMYLVYLRRMLRELDPSRAVPPRVRAAYDTLTEGLVVVDRHGAIVLANKSTSSMLGVDEQRLVGRSPSEFDWSEQDGPALRARNCRGSWRCPTHAAAARRAPERRAPATARASRCARTARRSSTTAAACRRW